MITNRTGAGFHQHRSREARETRGASKRRAIERDLADLVVDEEEPGYWDEVDE